MAELEVRVITIAGLCYFLGTELTEEQQIADLETKVSVLNAQLAALEAPAATAGVELPAIYPSDPYAVFPLRIDPAYAFGMHCQISEQPGPYNIFRLNCMRVEGP